MIRTIKKTGKKTGEIILEVIKLLPAILAAGIEIVKMIKRPK